jgi:hypothetical protein
MLTIRADKNTEAGLPPDPKLMAAIGQLTDEMTKAGILVDSGGLAPSSQLTRLRASGGKLTRVDGPFAETKEMIAGYAVVEVKSKDEAIVLGQRFMQLHQDILGPAWEGESEVRQMFGPGDFQPPGAK